MQMATQATSIFDGDAAGGSVKDTVAAFNVAMSLDVMPMQKHRSLARILVNCCAETVEVVNKYCFVHSVCGANTTRQSLTRLLVS